MQGAVIAGTQFKARRTIEQVEEGQELAPKFGVNGLTLCVTSDADSGEVLMLCWMKAEALRLTIEASNAHYFSHAKLELCGKGSTSGLAQKIVEARIDDDLDAIWLQVDRSCPLAGEH